MKILVISKESWRDEQNGGNVLTNMFAQLEDAEFAQIYCNEQEPNNPLCKRYYQMSDKMMLRNILHGTKVGRILEYEQAPQKKIEAESFSGSKKFVSGDFVRICRELVWKIGRWNAKEIIQFAKDFDPDIIFAPCYGNHYMHRLTHLVYGAIRKPVISYISDDHYTNQQLHFSPLYWLNHFLLRKNTRDVFKLYLLCYTMTDEQKAQCEKDFGANMKILRKSGLFETRYEKQSVGKPIRFVYGGGIYLNRFKTLQALATAMRKVNSDGNEPKMVLDIYTNNPLSKNNMTLLNDGVTARMHKAVSMSELRNIYHNADVALHCESFDLENQFKVRLSFSTKIIDCMDSGCAVMVICDPKQAGGAYLRRNDCAICVNKLKDLESTLRRIVEEPQILIDYQHRAFEVGRKNHLQEDIVADLKKDFEGFIK